MDKGRVCCISELGAEWFAEVVWVSDLSSDADVPSLTLVLSLTKGDAFGTALRMCTELGVDTFIPLQAQRLDFKGDKHARWSKIVAWCCRTIKKTNDSKSTSVANLEKYLGNPLY